MEIINENNKEKSESFFIKVEEVNEEPVTMDQDQNNESCSSNFNSTTSTTGNAPKMAKEVTPTVTEDGKDKSTNMVDASKVKIEVEVFEVDDTGLELDETETNQIVSVQGSATTSNSETQTTTSSSDEPPVQSNILPPSSSRLMRNLAEKMRRDKLNMYISELSSLVPIVAMATKRMDKTSVLRLSANFLRIHLSLKQNQNQERMNITPEGMEGHLSHTLLDALEGFMLIISTSGKIVYVSDSVEKLLGHSQLDLMGQSLYTICHNGDHEVLRHHLQPSSPFEPKDETSETSLVDYVPRSPSFFSGRPEDTLRYSGLASGERRSFYVRLAERSMARGDPARHVTVHLIGMLRPPTHKKETPKSKKKDISSTTCDEHLLVCVARPYRNKGITELSLMEAVQDEYVTRHLPDGRIVYSDHRISFVAGYLTEEVVGLSAFNFIHPEDLPWATVANKQMFSSVEGQGFTVLRLRSKTGSLIHLRTRGFLEFNKATQKVETFVCINTLLTPEEGERELEKERERITPFITFQQVTTTSPSTNQSSSSISGNSAQVLSQSPNAIAHSSRQSTSTKIINTLMMSNNKSPTVQLQQQQQQQQQRKAITMGPSTITHLHQQQQQQQQQHHSVNLSSSVDLVELPADQTIELFLSSPSKLTQQQPDLTQPQQQHVNGNSFRLNNSEGGSGSSTNELAHTTTEYLNPPNVSLLGMADDELQLQSSLLEQVSEFRQSPTIHNSTSTSPSYSESFMLHEPQPREALPRLKRSLPDVEDDIVSSSAKKLRDDGYAMPSALITSYNHSHSPHHHGNKWSTQTTTTTIIFDQHNNNG